MLISKWESVISEALNAIRTLLCTSTNTTPHERFFLFQRRSSTGTSLPSCLLKHHVRHSKHDPLASKVKLIEANLQYAQIGTAEGRQSTVSLRDLAPAGNTSEEATAMENRKYQVLITSPVKLGDQILRTSSSDTLPNESDYPYEPSSTSDSEERPIPQKWPHSTSETDTYFSDTQQPKHKKKNGAVLRLDPLRRNALIMITITCRLTLTATSYLNNQDVPKGPTKCQVLGKTLFCTNN